MPNVKVYNMDGTVAEEIMLKDEVFGVEVSESAIHQVVVAHNAAARQGTQSALLRGEVSGGGIKPWRQKGTGRARQGSTRAPQWTHGGVALGPKPRDYRLSMNKKARRAALYSALSAKVAEGSLIVVDDIVCDEYKTKTMVNMINALGGARKPLIVLPEVNGMIVKSCANIPGAKTALAHTINVYDILNADKFIASKAAIEKLEEVFA